MPSKSQPQKQPTDKWSKEFYVSAIGFFCVCAIVLGLSFGLSNQEVVEPGSSAKSVPETTAEAPVEVAPPVKNSVAVIGAGLSGLTAAYNLQKLGYNVTVYESLDRVGGKIHSVDLGLEGNPSKNFVEFLDDESEAATMELCGDVHRTDIGAVFNSIGNHVKDIADEVGVPYGRFTLATEFVVTLPNGGPTIKLPFANWTGFVAVQHAQALGVANPQEILTNASMAFGAVAQNFPEIMGMRLDGNDKALSIPITEFGERYGISFWVDVMRPIIVGYGYAYFETVPAAIMLKIIYPIVASIVGLPGEPIFGIAFPCGFQSLPEGIAAVLPDVRLNAPVTSVTRTEDYVEIEAEGQPTTQFEALVISTTLDIVPNFLNEMDELETYLFDKLVFQRYISTIANIEDNGDLQAMDFYVDHAVESQINHVSLAGKTITGAAETIYQLVDTEITQEEAFEVLNEDMARMWPNGGAMDYKIHKDTYNYFPTVTSEDFQNGFFDQIEELQGLQRTYYVGSWLSFEITQNTEGYARELVLRKFEPVSEE